MSAPSWAGLASGAELCVQQVSSISKHLDGPNTQIQIRRLQLENRASMDFGPSDRTYASSQSQGPGGIVHSLVVCQRWKPRPRFRHPRRSLNKAVRGAITFTFMLSYSHRADSRNGLARVLINSIHPSWLLLFLQGVVFLHRFLASPAPSLYRPRFDLPDLAQCVECLGARPSDIAEGMNCPYSYPGQLLNPRRRPIPLSMTSCNVPATVSR